MTEVITVTPNFIALFILCDALYRINKVAKGFLHMETWQMVWHIQSFFFVSISGVLLCVATHRDW